MVRGRATLARIPVRRVEGAGSNLAAGELLIRDDEPQLAGALLAPLLREGAVDLIRLNGLEPGSELCKSISEAATRSGCRVETESFPGYAVADLGEGYEAYCKSKSRNFRRQTKRIAEKVAGAGVPRLDRIFGEIEGQRLEAYAGRMFAVADRGWRAKKSGLEAERYHQRFYQELIDRFGPRGMIDLAILSIDDHDVAFTLGIIESDVYYQQVIGYDHDFAELSPGTHLTQLTWEALAQSGIRGVLSHGEYEYKERWATEFVDQTSLFILTRTLRARLSGFLKFRLAR
jgi:hypothetical protein